MLLHLLYIIENKNHVTSLRNVKKKNKGEDKPHQYLY
nr:MAG TPA: hypothetical protein [Caudoviricetes sp.]